MLQVSRRRRYLTGVPDSVTEAQPGVGGPESLLGGRLGGPVHHGAGLPAGQAHQLALGAASGKPPGRE
jgi:hypothetical protein